MSKTEIDATLEALREDLIEHINEQPLDMLEEFEAEEIADKVIDIARTLVVRKFTNGHFKNGRADYLYSINNQNGGWVSVSDSDGVTGVSRTMYFPFFCDEDGYFAGLTSLASMFNEAWYHCKNLAS